VTGPAVMPSGGLLVSARYSWRRRRCAVDWAMTLAGGLEFLWLALVSVYALDVVNWAARWWAYIRVTSAGDRWQLSRLGFFV